MDILTTHKKWYQRQVAASTLVVCVGLALVAGASLDRLLIRHSLTTGQLSLGASKVLGVGQLPPDVIASQDVDFRQFWDLWKLLKEKYYQQPLHDKDLFYGAMSGLVASTGDPYTMYFPPKEAAIFQQSLEGSFEGIGAEIGLKEDLLQIVAPLPDTPAAKAGLQAGDLILKIDDQETNGMGVDKAVSLIRGKKGTAVVLNIYRSADKKSEPRDVKIVRDEIQVKSVTSKMLEGNIAYINITHFNDDTETGFSTALDSLLAKNPKALILDVRNDPGGYLDTALSVTGEWIGNDTVLKERRQGAIVNELRGTGGQRLRGMPTVVLVNKGSASASEIVAGALQDYGLATLVGEKTFGKGSVQDYQTFKDGSGVKITIVEWLTPKERAINKTGLTPDVTVELTQADYEAKRDPQLDRAVAILNGSATSTSSQAASPTKP